MLAIKRKTRHQVVRHGSPILRRIRATFVAFAMLALVFLGAAWAYAWYSGSNSQEVKVAAVPTPKPKQQGPNKPSPTQAVNAAVQSLTTPIMPGENASITVHTNADANCTILVEYNKVAAKDSGLVPKKADDYGLVSWGWTVPKGTPLGKWPVTVTCANLKKSGVVIGNLEVSNKPAAADAALIPAQ
jgi:hypothetical protein